MPEIFRNLDPKLVFIPASVISSLKGVYSGDEFDILVDKPLVLLGPIPAMSLCEVLIMAILDQG